MRLLLVHGPAEGREMVEGALAHAGYRNVVSTPDAYLTAPSRTTRDYLKSASLA